MSLRLISAVAPILSTAEAKAHLRVFHDDDDAYIDGLVAAVGDWLFGQKSWLGLGSPASKWALSVNGFPAGAMELPKPPLVEVTGVFYAPATGDPEVELTDYRTFDAGVPSGGFILPAVGADWPETASEPNSVRILFTAGYATLPAAIKHAALLLVGHWYEHREAAGEVRIVQLPLAVDALLMPYRNWQI